MKDASDPNQSDEVSRCPDCGTSRVVGRKSRDHIDRMSRSPSSIVARLRGGKLFHCIFCRLQFYSTKPLASTLSYDKPGAGAADPRSAA
jgi:hypothetical protein